MIRPTKIQKVLERYQGRLTVTETSRRGKGKFGMGRRLRRSGRIKLCFGVNGMVHGKRWNLLNTLFLTGTLALALVLVPWRLATSGLRWSEALVFLAMIFAVGTAISGGYHRLFTHRAYN